MVGTIFKKPVTDWTEYTKVAEWCSRTQEATIEDKGDYYEVVPITKSEVEELLEKKDSIEEWFEWYDLQAKQYQRCQVLGIPFDKDIKAICYEANEKAHQLKQINKKLEEIG